MLDEAYPPGLAQSWDSVGLVCGDPDDALSSVTVAVDATAAVVDEVPDGGLLLAHHPLLLRGVDTVAASTAKGALVHRLIRTGRSLFTAHTNADSASPGRLRRAGRRAGADRRGRAGAGRGGADSGQVGGLRARRRTPTRCGRRCSRPAPATSATIRTAAGASPAPVSSCREDGASPAIGSVGTVERVAEDRVEVVAPARARGPRCWRRCAPRTPTRSPPSTSSRWRRCRPATSGWAGSVRCRGRSRCARSCPASARRCRGRRGECGPPATRTRRCRGSRCAAARATRCWTPWRRAGVQAYVTADLRHHPADEHRRASDVALVDVAHWASEFPWCEQAADVLRSVSAQRCPVRVCPIRTDPWNVESDSGGKDA